MGWIYAALLTGALAALVLAEWPRLSERFGLDLQPRRARKPSRGHLHLVTDEEESEAEEFAASVERDLSRLPTIEERDGKSRR